MRIAIAATTCLVAVSAAHASDRILVQYQQGAAPVALAGTTVAERVGLVDNLFTVKLSSNLSVADALAAYRADSRVAAAEADHLLSVSATPNDPRFAEQWALNGPTTRNVDASAAWDRTTGTSRFLVAVTVAVAPGLLRPPLGLAAL